MAFCDSNAHIGLISECPRTFHLLQPKGHSASAQFWEGIFAARFSEVMDGYVTKHVTNQVPREIAFSVTHRKEWSGREDLNLRPPGPEPGALPGCATPRH